MWKETLIAFLVLVIMIILSIFLMDLMIDGFVKFNLWFGEEVMGFGYK